MKTKSKNTLMINKEKRRRLKARTNAAQMAKTLLARRYREEYRVLYARILKEEFGIDTRVMSVQSKYAKYESQNKRDVISALVDLEQKVTRSAARKGLIKS